MRPPVSRAPVFDPSAATLVLLAIGLLLAEARVIHLWIGAAVSVLAIISLWQSKASVAPASFGVMPIPVLFALGVLALALNATQWALGGVHPLWLFTGAGGGAALDLEATGLGLLQLAAVPFAFLIGRQSARQPRASRTAGWTIIICGGLLALCAFAAMLGDDLGMRANSLPRIADQGFEPAFFGVLAILAVERLLSGVRHLRRSNAAQATWLRPSIAAACFAFVVAEICLFVLGSLATVAAAAIVMVLFAALSVLSASGFDRIPPWLKLLLASAFIVLALGAGVAVYGRVDRPALQAVSNEAHLAAFTASPMSGYGLGSLNGLNQLIMTRGNLDALRSYPEPDNSYLIWALQGGLLSEIPLLAAGAWALGLTLIESLRPRPLSGLMRACGCGVLFLALNAMASAGPSSLGILVLGAILLGLGIGASEA